VGWGRPGGSGNPRLRRFWTPGWSAAPGDPGTALLLHLL